MWDLQTHMQCYIAPSILAEARNQVNPWNCEDPEAHARQWLVDLLAYADCRDRVEIEDMSTGCIIEALAQLAIEYSATTNGGHEFYVDAYTTIEWCSEDEMQQYYA